MSAQLGLEHRDLEGGAGGARVGARYEGDRALHGGFAGRGREVTDGALRGAGHEEPGAVGAQDEVPGRAG